jgi:hypothetical protein
MDAASHRLVSVEDIGGTFFVVRARDKNVHRKAEANN